MDERTISTTSGSSAVPRAPSGGALRRERLESALAHVVDHRLVLVTGPAGAGKTTVLTQIAGHHDGAVAWYRADAADATPERLLGALHRAAAPLLPPQSPLWSAVDDAADALAAADRHLLIVLDDLHVIAATPAEAVLERLIDRLPAHVTVVIASREFPTFNLSRLRVGGELLELGPDDLRFRSWEVERLFRDVYRAPLPPEDLADLARRTEGWAAGLKLFHLATAGKTPAERRRTLAAMGPRTRLVREYLARNVVAGLPADLRRFLLDTCVLGRVTGALADGLRHALGGDVASGDGERMLVELERRQLFTTAVDDEGTYRYHEVLRAHLEGVLVEEVGEPEVRRRHRLAAGLLEQAGAAAEALRAYCRAEDWPAAARLLGHEGEALAGDPGAWIDALPRAVVGDDPWLHLAAARRHVAVGRFPEALVAYGTAKDRFRVAAAAEVAQQERQALEAWLHPSLVTGHGLPGLVVGATRRDPLGAVSAAAREDGPQARLAAGLAALLAGHLRAARALLEAAAEHADAGPVVVAGAQLALGAAGLLAGEDSADVLERGVEDCERLGVTWLARLGRALRALDDSDDLADLAAFRATAGRAGDVWGRALAGLVVGLSGLRRGGAPVPALREALDGFGGLGARVLEAWARAALALALARSGDDTARETAMRSVVAARLAGASGPLALAYAALAETDAERADEYRRLSNAIAAECGLAVPAPGAAAPGAAPLEPEEAASSVAQLEAALSGFDAAFAQVEQALAEQAAGTARASAGATTSNGRAAASNGHASPAGGGDDAAAPSDAAGVVLRCLGGFELVVGGVPIDLSVVKPRARSALRLLALTPGRPVHRERLADALWPEADAKAGQRNLQVAISSVRGLLEPGVARGASSLLVRDGEAYRLALPPDADVDLLAFEHEVAAGRACATAGDTDAAVAAYEHALSLYRGDLLPEEGPAEWVVEPRERLRGEAAAVAGALADLHLAAGRPADAARVAEAGLRVDRYRDALWRLLASALDAAGDHAAAARAAAAYEDVLVELGLPNTATA